MSSGLISILAQVEPDLEKVADSGIDEVTTTEWLTGLAVVIVSIVLAAVVRRVVERLLRRTGPPAVCKLGGRFAAFLVIVVGFFYALRSIDVAVGPLLGGLGILGIALAFSLQEILGNFASGVLLQTRRPIRIGDQIETSDYEGEVEDVNFRSVQLRTFDGETVYVPNSMVLQNPITNWTKTPTRRTSLDVGVAYGTDLAKAQRVITEAVDAVDAVEPHPATQAFVYEFGDSSINFSVRFWHGASILDMWQARDQAAQAINRALDDAGITIPFPQTTLWFGPGNTELTVGKSDRAEDEAGGRSVD